VLHDLKTPLAVLRVLSSSNNLAGPEKNELLVGAIQRINQISMQVLSMYRESLGAGASSSSTDKSNVSAIVNVAQEVFKNANLLISQEGCLELEIGIRDDERNHLLCSLNKSDLTRALMNLVTNAIEATDSINGAKIFMKIRAESGVCVIEMSDNGQGLDDLSIRKLNRHEFGWSTKKHGHGIGLSWVWKVIRGAGGNIKFEKNLSGGLTVQVRLPVHKLN
jgi:signal transduction histidine kinase